MRLTKILRAKIHHARVTYKNTEYVGSLELCPDVMRKVGLQNGEAVEVWDVENGERFETYVFAGDFGVVGVNGAAAKKVNVGDRLIIAAFTWTDEAKNPLPQVVLLDETNKVVRKLPPFSKNG